MGIYPIKKHDVFVASVQNFVFTEKVIRKSSDLCFSVLLIGMVLKPKWKAKPLIMDYFVSEQTIHSSFFVSS